MNKSLVLTASPALSVVTLANRQLFEGPLKPQNEESDPFLWLEELESDRSLAFVREQNRRTVSLFAKDDHFHTLMNEFLAILGSANKFPYVSIVKDQVVNFWKSPVHPRGIFRRASLSEFVSSSGIPTWETLIDIDALSADENEIWIWRGVAALLPAHDRCLVSLSRGGKDAVVLREFDLKTKSFVTENPFNLPEGKHRVAWWDADTMLLCADFGGQSLTDSGYPRTIRLWKRGQCPTKSVILLEGADTDVSMSVMVSRHNETNCGLLVHNRSFFEGRHFYINSKLEVTPVALPPDAEVRDIFSGNLIVLLRSDWSTPCNKMFKAGSLVEVSSNEKMEISLLYSPQPQASLEEIYVTQDAIVLNVLENVKSQIITLSKAKCAVNSSWQQTARPLPEPGSAVILNTSEQSNMLFLSFKSFLRPDSLFCLDVSNPHGSFSTVSRCSADFDTAPLVCEQHFVASKDGTLIPYFIVRRKDVVFDGKNPTLLHGYGGFEVSLTPSYCPMTGKGWLEKGGVFVLANIRGGGEFGPAWHQAALREKRQNAFDDFIAVAEDLIENKVTSPRHLGIMGGSNGGLLVGAVMVQRPDLFNAVVCQVPLLDMLRYHTLFAGPSWMAEYGNPDEPGPAADALRRYSPYQNLKPGLQYPALFVRTSTKDDRVHPGHARKMVAKLHELGQEALYYENIEGGHRGTASVQEDVAIRALEFAFLSRKLF